MEEKHDNNSLSSMSSSIAAKIETELQRIRGDEKRMYELHVEQIEKRHKQEIDALTRFDLIEFLI